MTIQWIAGFYEGEGSCCSTNTTAHDGSIRPGITLSINQKERQVLDLVHEFMTAAGVSGYVGPHKGPVHSPAPHMYAVYRVRGIRNVAKACDLLLPHMQSDRKIQQMKDAIAEFVLRRQAWESSGDWRRRSRLAEMR